jgi:hypothetical protein
MKARFFCKNDYWILVEVLEVKDGVCKILPTEWIGIERKELFVLREKLEFIYQG